MKIGKTRRFSDSTKVDKAKALSSFDPSTENASLQLFELYAFKGNRSFTSRSRGKLAELGVKGLACLLVVNAERSEVLNYALVDIYPIIGFFRVRQCQCWQHPARQLS